MRKFLDYETGNIVGYEDLQKEYEELKANNNTEAESFSQYLSNCMWYNNGTLKEV
jgi:hypothetical protein